jgi:pSer/pThr/pTyr-binding forkhead associated (FHA) protein
VEGLVLGRAPGDGPGVLELPEGIAGLSRRHCTLRRAGGETVLVDHSRFGTFVDGQRVDGRALLAAGSHLRLGTPGIELALVALD